MPFACMNENDSNLWGVAISLADHLCSGAELFCGSRDGRGGTQSAEFELKYGGGFIPGKGDGIQLAESVASAMVVIVFGVLVSQDTTIS